jgi:phosphoribosylglycinamide formyltransferase-1
MALFKGGWGGCSTSTPRCCPNTRGCTHQRAIDAGDSHGGVSVHLVTPELDDGPILGQTPVAIIPGDTAETLAGRVLFAEHQLYARCLSAWVRRESSPEWLADQVRTRAMALPEVDEVSSHGMPCFGIVKEEIRLCRAQPSFGRANGTAGQDQRCG